MAEIPPPGQELGPDTSAAVGEVHLLVGGNPRGRKPGSKAPSSWWWRLLMFLLASAGIMGGVALLALSFRWGLRLMLDPDALPQVQSLLTAPLNPAPLTTTTEAELRQSVTAAGQALGSPIRLTSQEKGADWLLYPILAEETGPIIELQVFQDKAASSAEGQLVEVDSVNLAPFSAEQVLAPLNPEERQSKVTPSKFTVQKLVRLPQPPIPTPNHWLTVEGQWSSQGIRLQYGQIVIFEPERRRLHLAETWSSPIGQTPQWIDLDGAGPADLVINETISMEPSLRGLQVFNLEGLGPSFQLTPVSWIGVPLDAKAATSRYQKALRLARSGLWREAHSQLQALKADLQQQWNPQAEAQLRLIARHAAISQKQAEQDWSMPTQKIMALLIDGQWEAALDHLEASPDRLEPLMRRLTADHGTLWKRISAAASLPEPDPAVFVWGGLALEAKQNRQAAEQWLGRQPIDSASRDRLTTILTKPKNPSPTEAIAASHGASELNEHSESTPAAPLSPLPVVQGVIGQVKPYHQIPEDDWYFPNQQPPTLVEGEQWYTVDVPLVRSDQQWQTPRAQVGDDIPAEVLWSALPFANQPSMTMVRWESSILGVSHNLYVKGLSINGNTLTLLAAGAQTSKASFDPIAFSDGALVWLSAHQHSTPAPNALMTPVMNEIRRHQGPLAEHIEPYTFGALLQEVKLHTLDLTGDGHLEQVLTFDRNALEQLQGLGIRLDRTAHKTMILTHDQELIYSDLFQPQTLVALTNPADGLPLSLVVYRPEGYGLLQWSATRRAFIP